MLCRFSRVWLFATLWTVDHQLLCLWDSPGKNTGVGCYALLQGIFPTQGLNPRLIMSPELAGRFFTTSGTKDAKGLAIVTGFIQLKSLSLEWKELQSQLCPSCLSLHGIPHSPVLASAYFFTSSFFPDPSLLDDPTIHAQSYKHVSLGDFIQFRAFKKKKQNKFLPSR